MKRLYTAIALAGSIATPQITAVNVEYVTSDTLITQELSCNAIIRDEFPGFKLDFIVLHCLMKKYAPEKIFEVGTCEGDGTLIITNATPHSLVTSLELPPQTPPYNLSAKHIGHKCKRVYQQVFGDSMTYDYAQHFPLDAWFIDGAHDYEHVKHETEQAIKSHAWLIVYHDTDIPDVFQAVVDGLKGSHYKLFRVIDTRISYALTLK